MNQSLYDLEMDYNKDLDYSLEYSGSLPTDDYHLREVKLNDYLPQVIGDASEIKEMNQIEDEELKILWAQSKKLFYNRWILTADIDGIKRYESLLKINPKGDLEERRRRVWFEWNKYIKYTDRTLRQLMDMRCGRNGYQMTIYHDKYVVRFELRIHNSMADLSRIRYELREIIPANMGLEVGVFVEYEVFVFSQFDSWKFPSYFSGQINSGHFTRGIVCEDDIVIRTRQDVRTNSPLYAGETSYYFQEPIYAVIERPESIYIYDASDVYFNDKDDIIIQSGGYF